MPVIGGSCVNNEVNIEVKSDRRLTLLRKEVGSDQESECRLNTHSTNEGGLQLGSEYL